MSSKTVEPLVLPGIFLSLRGDAPDREVAAVTEGRVTIYLPWACRLDRHEATRLRDWLGAAIAGYYAGDEMDAAIIAAKDMPPLPPQREEALEDKP